VSADEALPPHGHVQYAQAPGAPGGTELADRLGQDPHRDHSPKGAPPWICPKTVGQAFGIPKIALDLDLNIPRRDNEVGVSHRGFEARMDPRMTIEEAAQRRDFTINALALDLFTGEVHD